MSNQTNNLQANSFNGLGVSIAGVTLKNPVITASGTFGSGMEYGQFVDLNMLGAVTVKGVSSVPWEGNKPPRIAETYGGMLNSVGLQNPGVDYFIENDIPFLRRFDTKIIVNICGHTIDEYVDVTKKLRSADVDMLELNISCPNVSEGGITFGTDCTMISKVVYAVRNVAAKPLIVKLSPNVTDITATAKAAVEGGAQVLSLINTLLGMKIDIYRRKPVLNNKKGGLSGPCIKPVAVRMVYDVANAVDVPVIGMGGVSNWEDAVEMMMAGASAVAIGAANFTNPYATIEVIDGLKAYMEKYGVSDINDIIGIVK